MRHTLGGRLPLLDQLLEPHHLLGGVGLEPPAQQRLGQPAPRPFEAEDLAVGDDRAVRGLLAVERALELEEEPGRAADRRTEAEARPGDGERIDAGGAGQTADPPREPDRAVFPVRRISPTRPILRSASR